MVDRKVPIHRRGLPASLPPAKQRKIAAWTGDRVYTLNPNQERHPKRFRKQRMKLCGYDCTALWHGIVKNELDRLTRHLTPGEQRVARAFAADCTTGGRYYWSQERLGRRAYLSRPKTNRALKALAENGLIDIPKEQRHYGAPKTISLAEKLRRRVSDLLVRAVFKIEGNTRRAKLSVPPGLLFSGISLTLEQLLPRFRRKRQRSGGGWKVPCPCHNGKSLSLALAKGEKVPLVWHCFDGCDPLEVRRALEAVVTRPRPTNTPARAHARVAGELESPCS